MIGSARRAAVGPPAAVREWREDLNSGPDDAPLTAAGSTAPSPGRHAPWWHRGLIALAAGVFILAGAFGVFRYIENFWLYRGYAPPSRPSALTVGKGLTRHEVKVTPGTVATVTFASPALGGRKMSVLVYTPPGYLQNHRRYPVLYLLHGNPGSPLQFVNVGDVAVLSDTLIAKGKIEPMIIVMPTGGVGFFSDEEWANLGRGNDWESYVARDLVQMIDHRYRTIRLGSERGIAGLSEGGYGSLNIGLHHVGEFDLMEGWSPYFYADRPRLFGRNAHRLAYNSPAVELPLVSRGLRGHHVFVWLDSGTLDHASRQSRRFAAALADKHIASSYTIYPGHHNWHLWREAMPTALTIASEYFSAGPIAAKRAADDAHAA